MTPPRTSRTPASDLPRVSAGLPGCDPHPPAVSPVTPAGGSPVPLAGSASPACAVEGAAQAGAGSPVRSVSSASAADRAGSTMTERELEHAVRRILADLPQVMWYHTWSSVRSNPGFPDLVCCGPGGILFRELKTATGKVTAAQARWLERLRAGGADASVWRPADLLSGKCARELATLAGIGGSR